MSLSILIPSYNFSRGINIILNSLNLNFPGDFEIIIKDDSTNNSVSSLVQSKKIQSKKLTYFKNKKKLGAVSNWNSLIDSSNKDYLILIHHDEYPADNNFLSEAYEILKNFSAVDVFILDLDLVDRFGNKKRQHFPLWFRYFLIKLFPSLILIKNFIGPVSTLIIRRSVCPDFDQNLTMKVDMDFYYRLATRDLNWMAVRRLKINSISGREDSITATKKPFLNSILKYENQYLIDKYPEKSIFLKAFNTFPISLLFNGIWNLLRIFFLFFDLLKYEKK